MMNFLHRPMFQAITTNVSSEDAEVNKMARNLTDIKPTNLGVKAEFSRIVKLTKKELLKLNSFSTPFGRLRCLKRMVNCLSSSSSTSESKEETLVMTTDDFLPIMIYLIIKSEIPNWTANLMYMKLFHFSKCYQDDEYMFYLTTIEAALDYIKSGRLQQEALKSYSFKYVQSGDESAVRLLLGKPQDSDVTLQLCHPLCDCPKCKSLLKQRPTEQNLVTAYTRDDRGYTALHIASLHGQAHLVDLLIQHGAVVDASDYLGLTPLHLACRNGYQNIICVKALVFTDKTRTKIDINAQNLRGDTPIHLAAKWGYETIIMILLENNADTNIRNRKKQLPINLAQNSNVQKIFRTHDREPRVDIVRENTESLTEYQAVKTSKPRPSSISFKAPHSPTLITPVVASLDQEEKRQVDLLFKAIENRDIPLVYYYLKLNAEGEQHEEHTKTTDISVMCHPLCTCDKCSNLHQSGPAETPLHVNVRNRSMYTPLHKAAQVGSVELVSLFVRRGAEVNVTNHKHVTPLHIACYFAQTEYCAKVNTTNVKGNSPLHNAVRVERVDIITKLLNAGAYPLSKNKEDLTPFDFTKNPEIRDLLNSHITKSPIPRSLSDPNSPQYAEEALDLHKPEGPISIKDLFTAFEEKDLQTLKSLADSIKTFDPKENLKKTETKDTSGPDLRPLQHSLSIQRFDLSALRHVESLDKSDPMHIYNLSLHVKKSEQHSDKSVETSLPDVISLSSDETTDSNSMTNFDEDWVLPDVVGHSCVSVTPIPSVPFVSPQPGAGGVNKQHADKIISDCELVDVNLAD
ncbi:hypothetical protein FSP39_013342 [Pinctada imbricata]|uniref:VPS9 domain-containing protein n=1 Tax=Pinctada imbricata TaxID=66713 RepID=A0AA88XIW1_PINIB|nr:hypothetical protein FSP39_013342 [Pinctada imbricata]